MSSPAPGSPRSPTAVRPSREGPQEPEGEHMGTGATRPSGGGGHAASPRGPAAPPAGGEGGDAGGHRQPAQARRAPGKGGKRGAASPQEPSPPPAPALTLARPEQEGGRRRARFFIGAAGPAPAPPALRREGGSRRRRHVGRCRSVRPRELLCPPLPPARRRGCHSPGGSALSRVVPFPLGRARSRWGGGGVKCSPAAGAAGAAISRGRAGWGAAPWPRSPHGGLLLSGPAPLMAACSPPRGGCCARALCEGTVTPSKCCGCPRLGASALLSCFIWMGACGFGNLNFLFFSFLQGKKKRVQSCLVTCPKACANAVAASSLSSTLTRSRSPVQGLPASTAAFLPAQALSMWF